MSAISLKIHIVKSNNVKTMQFEESMIVYDVARLIRERVPDAAQGEASEYGLFNPDDDPTKGRWLEQGRTLDYYHLKNGDILEYRKKTRPLRIKTLDGSIKTILVDDSATVAEITKTVCDRIGITNPEEFFLCTESETAEMTLRRQQHQARNQKEMDRLKKRHHTDDELNWVNRDKSLREQGIDETEVLILRKRLFFTDDNVDVNDPVQVNLLFVQSRDSIVNGTHPCTKDEAVLFAAYQCQVQYGNNNEAKHKTGFLNLGEFLPKEYLRIKGIEKDIYKEHRKLHSMTEINAKYRYITLCRSLKTYGVTFFLVKEKMRGRNRLVPRLLGITRESVLRVDENTKEVLKAWPLTTVRRWAASPNSFTLDFGDYSESFYSVQTTEGEAISQLIAMYIDIIMQKKKPIHPDVPDEEDEPVIVESEHDPKKASMITYHPSTVGHGGIQSLAQPGTIGGAFEGSMGMQMGGSHAQHGVETGSSGILHMPPSMAENPQMMLAQQNVATVCGRSLQEVMAITEQLQTPLEVPVMNNDSVSMKWRQKTLDVSRQNVSAALAAMLASAASVITQTSLEPEEINYTAVGSSVTTISTNLSELAKAVRMLAALNPSEGEGSNLLDAARALAAATADLLNSAHPQNLHKRQELLASAGDMGTTGGQLLLVAGGADVDLKTQEALVAMAKAVASATAALVTNARNVAAKCEDSALQNQVIIAAKQTALATQSLIACTKVLAPTIDSHLCQEQLIEACKLVAAAVEKIVIAAQAACGDDDALRDLGAAATAVTQALNSLIEQIKQGVQMDADNQYEEACAAILAATDKLFSAMGDPQEMDENAEKNLRMAAEHLRAVTNATAMSAMKKKAIKKLEMAAKQASAVSTQLIAAAQGAGASNRNDASQNQLMNHCKAVAEQISNLVQAVRTSMENQDSPSAQLGLINSSQAMVPPAVKMVAAAKAAVPTVGDQASALQLGNFAKATAAALAELRASSAKAQEVCGSLELESAMDVIKGLAKELAEVKREAAQGQLLPLPGQTVESCSLELGATSKTVGSSMAQLLTAANQGNENYTGIAARDTANALQVLTSSVRGVAAFTKDRQTQDYIIMTAQQVMDQSVGLISEVKQTLENPTASNKQQRLAQAAKNVSQALNHMVNCLPGVIEYENAIKAIAQASLALQQDKFPSAGGQSYQTLQSNLSAAAAALNVASAEVVSSARGTPDQQAVTTGNFSEQFQELLKAGLMLVGASKKREAREEMLGYLRTNSITSSKLLVAAKALHVDPSGPNVQNQLAAAARAVTDSINALLNLCSTSGPGQKECDNALRSIEAMAPLLDNPNEPQSDLSYFDCLDLVAEKSKALGESGVQITSTAKKGDFENFGVAVDSCAQAVCQLTEAAAQAAYLVGVADPSSVAAVPGLVDEAKFARARQAIVQACESLLSASSTQEQVLSAATVIAKHTGTLCNACKLASSRTANPVAKKQFVQAAKDVASATANLVKNIKLLAADISDENREACAHTTKPLIDAVEALTTFASSPQFASTPAKISAQARVAQEPIVMAGKNVIKSSNGLLTSAKNLAIDPNDSSMWQLLAQHTKAVTDSMKALLHSIRTKCPGQNECDDAIDILNDSINQLDQAMLATLTGGLQPNASSSLQGFQEQMLQSVGDIKDNITPLSLAAKGEAEKLGHQVTAVANFFPSLAGAAIGAASRTTGQQMQSNLLEKTKTMAEAGLQMVYASKESGGNPKSEEAHGRVDEAAKLFTDAAVELTELLEKAGAESGLITGMVEDISKAQARIADMPSGDVKTFTEYQTQALEACRSIVTTTRDITMKASSKPSEINTCSREITINYAKLADATQGALATIESDELLAKLQEAVHELGDTCMQLVKDGSSVQAAPEDKSLRRDLNTQAKFVNENVGVVIATIQKGAVGTQACTEAINKIQGIVGDLETSAMFATAGALTTEGEAESLSEACHQIVETAKTLVDDTKRLVSSAGGTQEQLAEAATKAVNTIQTGADQVKKGASSLTSDDVEAQLLLLNAVRDVANAMGNLIDATKVASGKSVSDPAMENLKEVAKKMVGEVSRLLKTVKNVESEAARGVQSLEKTIDSIESDLVEFQSSKPPQLDKAKATPEKLVNATKAITLASSKTVTAGNSCKQIDISAAANLSFQAVHDLLLISKGAAQNFAQTKEQTEKVMACGRECAVAYKALLQLVHQIVLKPSDSSLREKLLPFSKEVASAVSDIVRVAGELKEGAGFIDMSNPEVRAEQELLAAAASIEAAAKKLGELTLRVAPTADANLSFDAQILEAAKSIAAATKSLVQSARATQRELTEQGKVSLGTVPADSQWSDGLVSAAKLVAESTSQLCEAANDVVQGEGDAQEGRLIGAAKAVAATTVQLLHAAQVKADAHSENNKRLQRAGQQVKKATEALVKAAQDSVDSAKERSVDAFGRSIGPNEKGPTSEVVKMKREIEAQARIVAKQKELEQLHEELVRIRRKK
uniref:FERM domain-containing protein n=1 Tax=Amphimedon queenslandica TaxID=400682 RepID=A0A1X7VGP0_AMPQE